MNPPHPPLIKDLRGGSVVKAGGDTDVSGPASGALDGTECAASALVAAGFGRYVCGRARHRTATCAMCRQHVQCTAWKTFGDHSGHNAQAARGNRLTNTPLDVSLEGTVCDIFCFSRTSRHLGHNARAAYCLTRARANAARSGRVLPGAVGKKKWASPQAVA